MLLSSVAAATAAFGSADGDVRLAGLLLFDLLRDALDDTMWPAGWERFAR